MVFTAQDPGRIIDLNQLIVLVSSTTTTGIDRRRVFVDDLWGLVGDLWRLVGRSHELCRRIIEGSIWRCIKLNDHLPSCPSEK